MRKYFFLTFSLLILGCSLAWSQSSNLPESHIRWRQERGGEKGPDRSQLEFFYYPYTSPTLDLRDFRERVPRRAEYIPEYLEVQPPELEGLEDVAYAVGWLEGDLPQHGHLIVLLVGNFKSEDPVFFVDWNLNRDFRNDSKPIRFSRQTSRGIKYRERLRLRVTSPEPDVQSYHFWLVNPKSQVRDSSKKPFVLKDRIALRSGFNLGFGKLHYRFLNPSSGYPTTFAVRTTNKGLTLQLPIRLGNLQIVPGFSYENVFYWSSQRTTRLGEPYVVCDIPGQGCVYFENILVVRDREVIPTTRLSYSLNLEYDLKLGERFRLSPFVGGGIQQYAGDFRHDKVEETAYELSSMTYLEYGGVFKAYFDPNHAILFTVSQRHSSFEPAGYFERFDAQDLKTINRTLILGIGVQVGLF